MDKFTIAELKAVQANAAAVRSEPDVFHLMVCSGTGCHATGSIAVIDQLREDVVKKGLQDKVKVIETGCNEAFGR